jgi:catechol O-methyltransferase
MTKGLTIARLLSLHTPHRIIAADIENTLFTSPGRYSRSVSKFYRLDPPEHDNSEPYIDSLLSLIRQEKVDLWISCSSVVGAIEDGEVVRLAKLALGSKFQAVQFNVEDVVKLHEKDEFMAYMRALGLPVPESHRCESSVEVLDVLLQQKGGGGTKWIMKPIGVDDRARANMMTLLPLSTAKETETYIQRLGVSKRNPFILQQYIDGPEYCTHALVIRGRVKAFVACPSSELLMHYRALPPSSLLSQKMLSFTTRVAEKSGEDFTGHLSFDFLVLGKGDKAELYPIECNPRAHTAVVLFSESEGMADAYLSVFSQDQLKKEVVLPQMPCYSYYWVGHDLVTLIILPFLEFLWGQSKLEVLQDGMARFVHHMIYWRDGTFTIWDPMPWWVLYHVYWPTQWLRCLLEQKTWSRLNVSTTKIFQS